MKLTWIILLFEIIPSISTDTKEELAADLEALFHYDFRSPLNIGDVIVWTISSENEEIVSKPETYSTHIPAFETNKTYLIFTRVLPQHSNIYYRVGQIATLEDKMLVARYALLQYTLYDEYINALVGTHTKTKLTREEEFIESESFWNTVNFVNRMSSTQILGKQYEYVEEYFPSRLPNLYIVKGTMDTARIKEVSLNTKWLKKDICLILETGYIVEEWSPIMAYCGPEASPEMQERTKIFSQDFEMYYFYMDNNYFETLHHNDPKFKAFIDILEDSNNVNPYEIDRSQDQLKDGEAFIKDRDNDVSLYTVHGHTILRRTVNRSAGQSVYVLQDELQNTHRCHLFDSASIGGLFFFLYYREELKIQLNGIEMVENYIHNKFTLASKRTRMKITEYWGSEHLNMGYQPM